MLGLIGAEVTGEGFETWMELPEVKGLAGSGYTYPEEGVVAGAEVTDW